MASGGREKTGLTLDCDLEKSTISRASVDSSGPPTASTDSPVRPDFDLELGHGISEEDILLARRDKNAVEFAFNYSKLWSKFCKDVVTTLEKRGQLENDYVRSLTKQFQQLEMSVQPAIGVPVRVETLSLCKYFMDISKDVESQNTKKCRELLEVLNRQRTEFARTHKYLKEKWKGDVKKLLDAESSLVRTKSGYFQRCQSGVKFREELSLAQMALTEVSEGGPTAGGPATPSGQALKQKKVDKLEKQLADNDKKEIEQMYAYRDAVETANQRMNELDRSKIEVICDIRLTTMKSDEVFKDTLADYLEHIYNTRVALIKQHAALVDTIREYTPCREYRVLLDQHCQNRSESHSERYTFEHFHETSSTSSVGSSKESGHKSRWDKAKVLRLDIPGSSRFSRFSGSRDYADSSSSPMDSSGKPRILSSPATDRSRSQGVIHSDSDEDTDISSLAESRGDYKEVASTRGSGVLNTFIEFSSNLFRPTETKKSVKNKRSAELYLPAEQLNSEKDMEAARQVISRCIQEIESQGNGIKTHGIYRVPASKVKVSSVMDSLSVSPDDANLSEELPLTLASVLKNKLISLPEPLLTYNLYPAFVETGKESENGVSEDLLKRLQSLVNTLPQSNKLLAGLIFHHLKNVSKHESENQMGCANLGTLFGPTLLRPRARYKTPNMVEFVDNKSQTKVVELMIDRVEDLFPPLEECAQAPARSPSPRSAPATPDLAGVPAPRASPLLGSRPALQLHTPPIASVGVGALVSATLVTGPQPAPTLLHSASFTSGTGHPQATRILSDSQQITMRRREAFLTGQDPTDRRRAVSTQEDAAVFDLDYIDTDSADEGGTGSGAAARSRLVSSLKIKEEQRRISTPIKPVSVESNTQYSVQDGLRRNRSENILQETIYESDRLSQSEDMYHLQLSSLKTHCDPSEASQAKTHSKTSDTVSRESSISVQEEDVFIGSSDTFRFSLDSNPDEVPSRTPSAYHSISENHSTNEERVSEVSTANEEVNFERRSSSPISRPGRPDMRLPVLPSPMRRSSDFSSSGPPPRPPKGPTGVAVPGCPRPDLTSSVDSTLSRTRQASSGEDYGSNKLTSVRKSPN